MLLQHSTVFPLHVSNSACYVPAVTQIERQYFYFWLLLLSLIDFPGHEEAVYIGLYFTLFSGYFMCYETTLERIYIPILRYYSFFWPW